ncbi:hypothetical protein TrST_g10231 [Triparma strigata]|nr:hypothetical protein TrST_g10231 [Triparma strigata]
MHDAFHPLYAAVGIGHVVAGSFMAFWMRSNDKLLVPPTVTLYHCMYMFFTFGGIFATVQGVYFLMHTDEPLPARHNATTDDEFVDIAEAGRSAISLGIGEFIPAIVVLVVGRKNLFSYIAKKFDKDKKRAESDGAFIAALIDTSSIILGKEWWVHRESPNDSYLPMDHRRNWQQGWIVDVQDDDFTVIIEKEKEDEYGRKQGSGGLSDGYSVIKNAPAGSVFRQISSSLSGTFGKNPTAVSPDVDLESGAKDQPVNTVDRTNLVLGSDDRRLSTQLARRLSVSAGQSVQALKTKLKNATYKKVNKGSDHLSKVDILTKGRETIRCTNWSNMSLDLIKDSGGSPETYNLSRPLNDGETIDFFMSHSWHDDASSKWETLVRVAEGFKKIHKRDPTFWLDKTCIDQENIGDGLKVLPVYVMASKKMLVLLGETYPTRLWCIWELFTLFSFSIESVALEKVQLEVFANKGGGLQKDDILDYLARFNISNSCCYDPNEESKLKVVIDAIGNGTFNMKIRKLGASIVKREQERRNSRAVSKHKGGGV